MKQILLVTLLTSLLTSGLTVGALMYMGQVGDFNGADLPFEGDGENSDMVIQVPATFVPLDKVILTVNGRHTDHLVLIEVAIKTRKPELFEDSEQLMPVIQNRLLRLFSEKLNEDIVVADAIDRIEREVEETINLAMYEQGETNTIEQVMVTSFIMQ